MRLLTHIYWTISQTLLGIRVNKGPFMLAVTLAALALTIPIFIISVMVCLNDTVINVPMNTEITAFTERSAGPNTVKDLSQKINRLPGVTSVRIIPKDDALKMVNKSLGLQSKRSANNPLPDIIVATLGNNVTEKDTEALAASMEKLEGIESTAFDDRWASYLARLKAALYVTLGILASVILILVILVVMSSVRMTTAAQREELLDLHIFGASRGFATAPYACRGLLTLVFAAAISLGITWIGISILSQPAADFASLYGVNLTLRLISTDWCLVYLGAAALVGAGIGRYTTGDALRKLQKFGF